MKASTRTLIIFSIITLIFVLMLVWNMADGTISFSRAAIFTGFFLLWVAYTLKRYFRYKQEEALQKQAKKSKYSKK